MVELLAVSGTTFPVAWNDVNVTGPPFELDRMHAPFPVCPLQASAGVPATNFGYATALRELHVPVREVQSIFPNHYRYGRFIMDEPASEKEARERAKSMEVAMQEAVDRQMARWHGEHLPRIAEHMTRLRTMELRTVPPDRVSDLLGEVDEIQRDLWTIHFRIAPPMLISMQLFTELYVDLFGGIEADAHALLVGGVSESIKAAFGLADLAATARGLGLESVFRETPPEELREAVRAHARGPEFVAQLDRYLDDYGYRQDLGSYMTSTWREEPMYALVSIRTYLRTGYDAPSEQAERARATEDALSNTRSRLASYPEAVRQRFEAMLETARHGAFLQEEHNFYIDQHLAAALRLLYMKLGQRLVEAGVLLRPDDIFMLDIEEVREIASDADAARHAKHARGIVARRRDEMEIALTLDPPQRLGASRTGPSPPDSVVQRAITSFFGTAPDDTSEAGLLRGSPASRGGWSRASHAWRGRCRKLERLSRGRSWWRSRQCLPGRHSSAWSPLS